MTNPLTTAAVWFRFVEAAETLVRMRDGGVGPRGVRSNWPPIVRDFADAVSAEQTRREDGYKWPADWLRAGPPAALAIDRMHECWAWTSRYLAEDHPDLCRALTLCAYAKAIRKPVFPMKRPESLRGKRVYTARDEAVWVVRDGLRRDGDRVRPANIRFSLRVAA